MGFILDRSSPVLRTPIPHERQEIGASSHVTVGSPLFQADPHQESFGRFVAGCLGFDRFAHFEIRLEQVHELAVPGTVKNFANQGAVFFQVVHRLSLIHI